MLPSDSLTAQVNNTHECSNPALEQQLHEAETLTNELKRLLVHNESALEQEGVRQHLQTLERWMESYRHGLSAARKISENGATLITEMRQRLKLAADELHRLEGEGGNPASKEQASQAEELMKVSRHIEKILPNIEHIFSATEPAAEKAEEKMLEEEPA